MNWLTNLFKRVQSLSNFDKLRQKNLAKKYHTEFKKTLGEPSKRFLCFSLDCSQRFSTAKARSEHEEQEHGVMRVVKRTENECHG